MPRSIVSIVRGKCRRIENLKVAFIATWVQPPIGDGVFDCTSILVVVGTILVSALGRKGSKISKQAGKFSRDNIPKLELTDPRCVDDRSRFIDSKPLSRGRGVFSFLIVQTDRLHSLCKSWDQMIEEARFTNAALTNHCTGFALHPTYQLLHPPTFDGTEHQDPVAHLSITADEGLELLWGEQIALVQTDGRLDAILLGGRQDTVDQVRLDGRLGGTCNHEDLVDIRCDDMPAIFTGAAQF